ncbi:HET-domain-containing protein [Coniochaeta sp. PMI_546]|nr:HET-domain-containing protein [Coniochaeta sp. PMI_546]
MRLINVDTYEIETFQGEALPEFGILSHTWGQEEVSLQDMQNLDLAVTKKGFRKIEYCCRQAKADGWQFAWVDTCCIDKTSSAELSEAINSMYRWYSNAMNCYAYLVDTEVRSTQEFLELLLPKTKGKRFLPRWFSRGWTLQELIAPFDLQFFTVDWVCIGSKRALKGAISAVTGIPVSVLDHSKDVYSWPVASRMRWASMRNTTRSEDLAYCLMGIFNVHLPLLYGEGHRAFIRLQEEILKTTNDHTLFIWGLLSDARYQVATGLGHLKHQKLTGMVAQNPRDFQNVGDSAAIGALRFMDLPQISANGLRIDMPVIKLMPGEIPTLDWHLRDSGLDMVYVGALNCDKALPWCARGSVRATVVLLRLTPKEAPAGSVIEFARIPLDSPPVSHEMAAEWPVVPCYVPTSYAKQDFFDNNLRLLKMKSTVQGFQQIGRLPFAHHPAHIEYFGISQSANFFLHRVRVGKRSSAWPTIDLVYGIKDNMVYCDIVPSDTSVQHDAYLDEGSLLPEVQNRYKELDDQNLIRWIHTFGRSGPVAEYESVFGTLKVTARISCRAARPSDLGRFASVIASINFIIYTPWVAFEQLENDIESSENGVG